MSLSKNCVDAPVLESMVSENEMDEFDESVPPPLSPQLKLTRSRTTPSHEEPQTSTLPPNRSPSPSNFPHSIDIILILENFGTLKQKRLGFTIMEKLSAVEYAKTHSLNATSRHFNVARSCVREWVKKEPQMRELL